MSSRFLILAVRGILASRIATTATLLAVVATAQAQSQSLERTITVEIAPQKLSTALLKLTKQTGLQLLMPGKIVDEQATQGVHGTMSVHLALTKLLEGTSLRYRTFGENVIGIELAEDKPNAGSAEEKTSAIDALEEVVVRGVEFRYEEVLSANKMPASVKDTPQSVKVVTRDLIDFAGVQSFGDIYKVDASSAAVHTGDHYPRQYYRGFSGNSGNGIKVDGFRTTSELSLDLAVFER
ncbi:STN domain-containing protein, partial [Steroidobacter sp.]|uniref:STN domain-containing protein n=1 Tax=Steroidobacter sp. TaxID=1978227 RepID=UPI001A48B29C